MIKEILFALWFFLPAGIANAAPLVAAHMPLLKHYEYPLDFGLKIRGKRIFGSHKTWRGVIVGVIMATLILWLQQILVHHFGWAQSLTDKVNYDSLPTLIVGPLFGLGALGGDAIESFIKRQIGVPPGQVWFPFDQIDYIIGGALATYAYVRLGLLQYVLLLFVWLMAHLIAGYAGYLLKLKKTPI